MRRVENPENLNIFYHSKIMLDILMEKEFMLLGKTKNNFLNAFLVDESQNCNLTCTQ